MAGDQYQIGGNLGDLEHLIARYDGEIRFTDTILGRILEVLAAASPGRSTLVVVTADHGEEFFDHGGKGHKKNLHAETVNVPLLVKYPTGADRAWGINFTRTVPRSLERSAGAGPAESEWRVAQFGSLLGVDMG